MCAPNNQGRHAGLPLPEMARVHIPVVQYCLVRVKVVADSRHFCY